MSQLLRRSISSEGSNRGNLVSEQFLNEDKILEAVNMIHINTLTNKLQGKRVFMPYELPETPKEEEQSTDPRKPGYKPPG